MDKSRDKIATIISTVNETFPDENDLKGFLGISRTLIVDVLTTSQNLLLTLKEHENLFEVIVLKRELADLFEKVDGDLNEKFEKIKSNQFNSFLRHISRIKFLIKEAYTSVIDQPPIRTEAEIANAKDELGKLNTQIEGLKNSSAEIILLNDSTKETISTLGSSIKTEVEAAMAQFSSSKEEVSKLKDSIIGAMTSSHDEIGSLKKSAETTISNIEADKQAVSDHLVVVSKATVDIEASKASIEDIAKSVDDWQKQIDNSREEIAKNLVEYTSLTAKAKSLLDETESTQLKIFGKKDENGNIIKGYFQETEDLKNALANYLDEQKRKYQTQFDEIESLLPGATSAGLAQAYQTQKLSYRRPILIWSVTFIFAVVAMAVLSVILIYDQSKNSAAETLNAAFIGLLKDLPFFIPTVWLASYASKQQSQFKRLQQEYAFKETNAKSFHGHKIQIEALMKDGVADENLLLQLLAQLVVITAQNPSETLDNKAHEDNSPILKLVEKLFPSIFKKGVEGEKEGVK